MAIAQPTTNTQATATVPATNLSGTPISQLHVGVLPSTPNDPTAKTTPIISANQATDDYLTKQNATNQIAQGVATQAQNNTQNQANQQTQNTQTSQQNQSSPQNTQPTPVDNSDLTSALNGATNALNGGQPIDNTISNADAKIQVNDQFLAQDQASRDATTTQFNNAVSQITNGTFPLTAPQQASLNQTQSAVNQLIQSAQQQAQLYQQAGTTFGAVHGLAQFAPGLALQAISAGMAKGQAAIAQAEMSGAKQLADLQKGFADDDFSMISKSYDALQASLDKKDSLLNTLNTNIQKQVTDYQTQQDKLQTNARDAINTILTQLGGKAFNDLTPEQQTQLDSLEKTAGWPVGMVKAGLNTVAEQKAQATQALAQQRLQDQEAQNKIADEFKQAALNISQQRLNITLNNSTSGSTDASVAGITGSPTVDATQSGYASVAVPGAGGLTQAAIDQAALQYATTGQMPSIGLGSTGAAGQKRNAIQNRAGELNSGGNIAANKATLAANTAALKQQTTYINTVTRAVNNAQQGVQQLINSFQNKGINDSSLPIVNILQNGAKYQLGSGDVSAYKAGLQEVANEYTQVFSRGGQTSESTRTQAQNIIDGNISIANLQKVSDELQSQGDIVIKGAAAQVHDIQKQINNITIGANNSSDTSSTIPPAPKGEMNVTDKATGRIGHIPVSEFSIDKYSRYNP